MVKKLWLLMAVAGLSQAARAQDFMGSASIGSQEPLFSYDDQQRWKHGYLHEMPYYGGYHSFRPYNYHHVFGQAQTAAGWGMSANMPYSQQFWHRYEHMTNLNGQQYSSAVPQPSTAPQMHAVQQYTVSPPQYGVVPNMQPMAAPNLPAPAVYNTRPAGNQVAPVQYQAMPQEGSPVWNQPGLPPMQQNSAMQQYLLQGPALP